MQGYSANMQRLNWDDLRYFLAVHRTGTFSAAARHLGVDDTTVSRRLQAMQRTAGTELFHRLPDANLKLTPVGHLVAEHAERMERQADGIGQVLGEEAQRILGKVRITSVPLVINRLLVPSLPRLAAAHPGLTVELVPDARALSLTRREADLAIRLARPTTGGSRVTARRIGMLSYGVFTAKSAGISGRHGLPWITYDETMAHLPQAKWLAGIGRPGKAGISNLRVTDAETAIEAAACGIGKAVLPLVIGSGDPRLQAVDVGGMTPLPEREVWLLSHVDQRDLKSIRAAREWIETIRWSDGG